MNPMTTEIDALKAQWLAAQPLKVDAEERLWRKFRLEWNYNSNHIEGNTLTYGETELLLILGQTKGSHTLREYDEMKAHDVAVQHIVKLAEERGTLREIDIRNINKLIQKEPFWKEGLTADGQPTQTQVIPGEYKRNPNNVRTSVGEFVHFASPTDTPAKMAEFVAWFQSELDAPTMHPVEFAAQLHHRFLLIHPFDDGNGRVARLLANFVLLRESFTPLIIKSNDKANYIAALRNADVGDLDPIIRYFAKEVQWSLEVGLRASRGESIVEPSDLEKEMILFVRSQEVVQESRKLSEETLWWAYNESWHKLFTRFHEKMGRLSPLFSEMVTITGPHTDNDSQGIAERFKQSVGRQCQELFFNFNPLLGQIPFEGELLKTRIRSAVLLFDIQIQLRGYKARNGKPFDVAEGLTLRFAEFQYQIVHGNKSLANKLYGDMLSEEEIEQVTNEVVEKAFANLKTKSGAAD